MTHNCGVAVRDCDCTADVKIQMVPTDEYGMAMVKYACNEHISFYRMEYDDYEVRIIERYE